MPEPSLVEGAVRGEVELPSLGTPPSPVPRMGAERQAGSEPSPRSPRPCDSSSRKRTFVSRIPEFRPRDS